MASNICDNLRNLKSSRSDWKIRVRLIRVWKVVTRHGDIFKGMNLLLLDGKKCRMHAFVPGSMTERMGRILVDGNLYVIKNFQVKEYTTSDKYRAVEMDKQIIFTTETKIKELDESEVFIPKNMFDLFEYAQLQNRAKQQVFLTDIIGVVEKKDDINRYTNKEGVYTVNVRFKLSDGRKKLNVTFWGPFAEDFEKAYTDDLEQPVILIIASAKISAWHDEIDVANYSPTQFYINYDHHSVALLRKMLQDPNFSKHKFSRKRKPLQVMQINNIKNLTADFTEDEVICKITIKLVEIRKDWNKDICSSCYMDTKEDDGSKFCTNCDRIVPHCLKRFKLTTVVADETGGLEMVLNDREVMTLVKKSVNDLKPQDNLFPPELKKIQGNNYTVILRLSNENKDKKDEVYVASNIMVGWEYKPETLDESDQDRTTQTTLCEPSGSSFHLDNISQLNTPAI